MATNATIKVVADTSQAERALGSLNNSLKAIASIALGGNLAKQFLAITSDVQEMTNKLIFATGSVTEANRAFGILAETSKKTGSNLGGTVDLFQKLSTSATLAGSSTEAIAAITSNFSKTLQISGASGASAAASLYQFAQAMQKGSLNGDEFRTMAEANGYFITLLTKELKISQSELRQWSQDGKLSAEVIARALMNSEKIASDYSKTIRTIPQAFENLQTSIAQAVQQFDKVTGAGSLVVKVLEWFSNNIPALVGGVVGLTVAMGALAMSMVAVRTAMISTGIGAIIVAAGVAAGYLADKMGLFGSKASEAVKPIEEQNAALQKGLKITEQRGQAAEQLDSALKKQLSAMTAANNFDEQATGRKSLQLDVAKAIGAEQAKYADLGKAMLPAQEAALALETTRKILNDERLGVEKQLLDFSAQQVSLKIQDVNESAIAADLEKLRLNVTQETFDARRAEYEQALRTTRELQAQHDITKAQNEALSKVKVEAATAGDPRQGAIELAVLQSRNQFGTAYTAELEKQDRVIQAQIYDLNQQAQVQKTLADLVRAQTPAETASKAAGMFGGTQAGILIEQQRQQDAVKMLKDQGLIDDQAYADQRVLIEKTAMDQLITYEQNVASARMKMAGVTNDAIIRSVQDNLANVKMMQQGGVVGFQGMLGAIDSVMGAMSTQNRKAFEAHKALATAQAIISTYQAAAMALGSAPFPWSLVLVAGAIAAGFAQVSAIQSQQYSGRKFGGGVMGNSPYLVGENGPEIFTPASAGQITPTDKIGGNQAPMTLNFNITANDTTGFDELITKRKGLITQIIRDAQLERGQRVGY